MTSPAPEPRDHYSSSFALAEPRLAQTGKGWLHEIRKEALRRFLEAGFPSTKQEEWKYTSVTALAGIPFAPAAFRPNGDLSRSYPSPAAASPSDPRIVFVNGVYRPKLSALGGPDRGLALLSLRGALNDGHGSLVAEHLTRHARHPGHPFVALNTAFLDDGALVIIPSGATFERPIHLVFISSPGKEAALCQPRTLILAGKECQASIVEHYLGTEGEAYFTNAVTELALDEGAALDHYRLVRERPNGFHIGALQASQKRGSRFRSYSLSLGGRLVRNDLNTLLAQEGSECMMAGLYLASGSEHVDHHTMIDHAAPHCASRQSYNGVLGGTASGVFNGKVIVRPDAQKTSAQQSNRNLLLSEEAVINTKPQLEIFADDVKCTHAATVGRIDENALFYLRSRGLDLGTAKQFLIRAFAAEVLSGLENHTLRSGLIDLLSGILETENWVEAR